jgi:hypothetical protein
MTGKIHNLQVANLENGHARTRGEGGNLAQTVVRTRKHGKLCNDNHQRCTCFPAAARNVSAANLTMRNTKQTHEAGARWCQTCDQSDREATRFVPVAGVRASGDVHQNMRKCTYAQALQKMSFSRRRWDQTSGRAQEQLWKLDRWMRWEESSKTQAEGARHAKKMRTGQQCGAC